MIVTSACVIAACGVEPATEAAGGAAGPTAFDETARAAVVAAVDSATRAFHAAEVARDGDAVAAHIAPDFYMYGDGVRAEYDDVVPQLRATLPSLRVFDAEWSDIEVRALGPDAAIATFRFRDSVVSADGEISLAQGPTTLVWERRGDDWLITYVDADHYPVKRSGSPPE